MIQYITEQTSYVANPERSHVVEPKRSGSNMFYIIVFNSEVEADAVRMVHWKKFADVGLFATEDLTPMEQECK